MSFKDNYPLTPPTLSLDFVNSATIDPRVTFSRSSKATYYNPAGLLTVADVNVPRIDYDPITYECKGLLIEELRTNLLPYSEKFDNEAWTKSNSSVLTNLLTYSQEFDNASWAKTNATVTANAVISPDGTTTGDTVLAVATGGDTGVRYTTTQTSSTVYTASIYAKYTNARYLVIRNLAIGATLGDQWTFFDLLNGTIGTKPAGVTAVITPVGGGWYRCSVSATTLATIINNFLDYRLSTTDNAYSVLNTSTINIWGAQLVQGTNPEQYTVTTSAAAPIQVTSPLGFVGAQKLVENTVNAEHFVYKNRTASNETVTLSIYAKAGERNYIALGCSNFLNESKFAIFNLTTGERTFFSGTSGVDYTNANAYSIPTGNGWFRFIFTVTKGTINTINNPFISVMNSPTPPQFYTGDGTSGVYIFGAQLEVGAFPTSYIPTITEQVIRTADNASMTGTNFSSWYNQSEGTVAVEYDRLSNITASGVPRTYSINDGTLLNEIDLRQQSGSGEYFAIAYVGASQASIANIVVTAGNPIKTASSYATNNVNSATNTILGVNDNLATIPSVTRLDFGNRFDGLRPLNGHIKSFKYYPIRLTNAQLQTLTNP